MSLQSIFNDPDNGDYTVQPAVIPQLAAPANLPVVAAAMGTSTKPTHIGAV